MVGQAPQQRLCRGASCPATSPERVTASTAMVPQVARPVTAKVLDQLPFADLRHVRHTLPLSNLLGRHVRAPVRAAPHSRRQASPLCD
jgi:hypothetical protein